LRRVTSVVVQDVGENKISFALTSGPTWRWRSSSCWPLLRC
jgi:hypothetical protein